MYQALRYYGGKSPAGPLNRWIREQLPYGEIYAEPFCGMAGILLARNPSQLEIINDIDGRVSNWWHQVREQNPDFLQHLEFTAWDEHLYNQIFSTDWDTKPAWWKAWAFTVICEQSFSSDLSTKHFKRPFQASSAFSELCLSKILKVAERIKQVHIYNMDAIKFTSQLVKRPEAVIYLDPPYFTANDNYKHRNFDREALTQLLSTSAARCAISGYPGEWDHLRWNHTDFDRTTTTGSSAAERTERLWANFELCPQNSLF